MATDNPNYKEVADYYDKTWAELDGKNLSRINDRHRFLMKYLLKSGMKRSDSILEIGCGVATVTNMLANWLTKGKIMGVDISPETIAMVSHRFKDQKNMRFMVTDMTDFKSDEKFDIILFPDVLEHIPAEAHDNIFKTISTLLKPDGKVLINIPDPLAMEYIQKFRPELLQIIDQAIHADHLIPMAYKHGLILEFTERYNVYFDLPEYQYYSFGKRKDLKSMHDKGKYDVLFSRIKIMWSNAVKSLTS